MPSDHFVSNLEPLTLPDSLKENTAVLENMLKMFRQINYMPWCFILELLFKINITLLQCKMGGEKEKIVGFFFLEICFFSHVLVQTAASIVFHEVFFFFLFLFSLLIPWFVLLTQDLHAA